MPGRNDIPFAIGSATWPGLAKLAEENGEVGQVIGKLMAFPEGEHPDGGAALALRLATELADLTAAVRYVRAHCTELVPLRDFIDQRTEAKFALFQRWDWEATR